MGTDAPVQGSETWQVVVSAQAQDLKREVQRLDACGECG